MSNQDNLSGFYGEAIHVYTRAQAIADGVLVDVSTTAGEAGFRWPVALSQAAWEDCVAWTDSDNRRWVHQDEHGRLWDVLWMAVNAIRRDSSGQRALSFQLDRLPRHGKTRVASLTTLKLVVGPGDTGEPVVTIMLPAED